ncbi:ATPase domain-containing protein [Schlesneria paludicola]|uniref:ATPase domain-containing protein n=1 Tax=Schlesneria paludicola TaxID=360056 RepID=UPI00029A6BE1|nr:ATPase domain-containing protein [Schlesneria paludicola]
MSSSGSTKRAYIPSGVPGLDQVLHGGFLREGFYLLQADPGSGKTTVALQFVLGRVKAREACLYVTLTESRADLEDACASHGWTIEGLQICDFTENAAQFVGESRASVFHPSETELGETTKAILAEVERLKPQHVVFDGLAELRLLSGDSLRYRRQLLALKQFFKQKKITVLLLDDRSSGFDDIQPESLVGANIVMERFLPEYGKARRRLFVTKVRGANFREGYNDYEIIDGGVIVHPRLVAAEHHERFERSSYESGVDALDEMLGGGLTTGTTTLLLGPAGVGKSTVAMQYVATALRKGEPAAVYTFDEVIDTLFDRSEKLCRDLPGGPRKYQADGLLRAKQIDAAELTAGAFAYEVRMAVEAGTRLIVIDSLNGYMNAMPEERFLITHLHELFAYLNQKGVITIMVVAQHGLMVGGMSEIDVSYLADTVLLFRYFEALGEIRQAVSVFKKRTGMHQRTVRELRITEVGVSVGHPLVGFRGIMTGTPEYIGETRLIGENGIAAKETCSG